jgi:hypothetical protein
MTKLKGAVVDTEEGARCAFMGYGLAVSGYGNTDDGRKFYAVTGSDSVGVPGDDAKGPPPEGPDIVLLFRDNASIQRVIDELVKLRDK